MPHKIAILTLYTADILPYAQYGLQTKRAYAAAHGYDFVAHEGVLDDTRAPAWSKIKLIERHLDHYDWVFWTDADSLIMNVSLPLERLIAFAGDRHMVMTRGPVGKYNTGQWLLRSSDWVRCALQTIWDECTPHDAWRHSNPWEQQSLVNVSESDPAFDASIAVAPVRQMNSRPALRFIELFPELEDVEYAPGDFIVHFYHSKSFATRLDGMRHYYDLFVAQNAPS